MKHARLACAILLALPLIVFGSNYFIGFFELPEGEDNPGVQLLNAMREGGLMAPIALSHVVAGIFLLIPRTRFAAALINLPMSVGITAFHLTMLPEGTGMAIMLLLLNGVVAYDPPRIRDLLRA